jgi:hypothetical protein
MNLKGKQIQTLFQTLVQTYFLNLKKAKRVMWAVSYLPTPCSGPTQAACRPTRPRHRPPFLFLSPTGGPRLAVTVLPPSLILFSPLRLTPCAGQPSRPSAPPVQPGQRAGRGAAGLPGWHARQGPARAGREAAGEKVKDIFAPPAGIQGVPGCSLGAPPAPLGGGAKGTEELSPSSPAARIQKERRPAWAGDKANHPPLGVSTSTARRVRRSKGEGGRATSAPRRCRRERARRRRVAQDGGEAKDRTGAGTSSPPRSAEPCQKRERREPDRGPEQEPRQRPPT